MANNKVVFGNEILMDLTEDTVTEDKVLEGETFHDKSGVLRSGNLVIPVQDVEVNGESVVDAEGVAEVVIPVSGDVSVTDSFESYTGGKVKSVQMELSPNQDLHGYENPWVGGASKNLLLTTVSNIKAINSGSWSGNVCTIGGVEFEVLTDDADNVLGIKATRKTASSNNVTFNVASGADLSDFSGKSLIINGAGTDSSDDMYLQFYLYDGTNVISPPMGGDSAVFTANPNSNSKVRIVIRTVANPNGVVFRPMIRLATETDPTFAPYSNICPISAHTQAKLEQRGKNRLENSYTTRTINGITLDVYSDGTVMAEEGGTATGQVDFILGTFNSGGVATILNGCPSGGSSSTYALNATGGYSDTGSGVNLPASYNNQIYIRIRSGYTIPSGGLLYKPMIRLASDTNSDYEPYQGKDYIINLGGSYYWVRGDVVSGKWYVVGQSDDLGTLTWQTRYTGSVNKTLSSSLSQKPLWAETAGEVQCEDYKYNGKVSGASLLSDPDNCEVGLYLYYVQAQESNAKVCYLVIPVDSSPDGKVVYELNDTIPINLNSQQIEAFLGENNFSAPLEQQEIIEIIARNIAEFNEVIDDENISDEFTYSSEKIEDRLDEYVDKDAVEEKSATDEFTTINGGLLSSLKVTLSPNQDLHGYDNPWVGGASKQLYNHEQTSNNNILVTLNNEGSLDAVGTPSLSVSSIRLCNPTLMLKAGTYKATLISGNNLPSGVQLSISSVIGGSWTRLGIGGIGETFTFTLNDDNTPIGVTLATTVTAGTAVNITNIKLLITADNVTDRTWCPYSNICPISGHTQVEVENEGKNLFDPTDIISGKRLTNITGTAYNSTQDVIDESNSFVSSLIKVTQGNIVTKNSPSEDAYHRWHIYDSNGICVRYTSDNVITIGSGESYVALCGANSEINTTLIRQGYQVTVNLGGTYYSGTLDVVSGVFTPDTAFDTLSADNFNDSTGTSGGGLHFYDWNNGLSKKSGICLCSMMPQNNPTAWASTTPCIQMASGGGLIRCYVEEATKEAFKTAYSGMQIVYELDTPTPIQLSPTMVKALVGENHLSAPLDGQEITESKYRELFTWDEVEEIAQKIADSKIDDRNISYDTTFSSHIIENRYAKKIWDVPVLTPYYQVSAGATEVTFTNQFIFSDYQTSCELIQIGGGPRVGISDVVISMGSVKFTFDAPLTALTRFVCSIMNFY